MATLQRRHTGRLEMQGGAKVKWGRRMAQLQLIPLCGSLCSSCREGKEEKPAALWWGMRIGAMGGVAN